MWYDVRRALDRDLSLIQKQLFQFFYHSQFRSVSEHAQTPLNHNTLPIYV